MMMCLSFLCSRDYTPQSRTTKHLDLADRYRTSRWPSQIFPRQQAILTAHIQVLSKYKKQPYIYHTFTL